jgi:methyl-accepting chemotaxis protein
MRSPRSRLAAPVLVLALTSAVAVPAPASAQTRVNPALLGDSLTAQERDMLTLAQDFARRCGDQLEAWVTKKEVSEERLFSYLYYPVPRTDPPKFTTDWDHLSDRDIQAIEESVMAKSSEIVFAVLVDRQGYLPTHNQRYSLPLTGNAASDLVNNRTKRIFNDRTGLAAARSEAPFLIQKYQRDTGETMVDLSVPLFVRGVHWGAVRIGYRQLEGR